MFVIAFLRARHSVHDFADRHKEAQLLDTGIKTEGQDNTRIFGRPFVTAGWTVVQVTVAVAVVELGLLGLIIRQVFTSFFFYSCVLDRFSFSFVIGIGFLECLCTCIMYDHLYQYSIIKFQSSSKNKAQVKRLSDNDCEPGNTGSKVTSGTLWCGSTCQKKRPNLRSTGEARLELSEVRELISGVVAQISFVSHFGDSDIIFYLCIVTFIYWYLETK